jgi:hypothetical protein
MAAEGDSLQSKLAELSQASERWHAERSQLTTDLEQARRLLTAAEAEHSKSLSETRRAAAAAFERQMDRVRSELTDECDRLKQEVEQLARSAAQWNTERVRLMGEVERANRLFAESQAAPRAVESPAPAPAATPAPAPAPGPAVPNENLRSEIARVEGQIKAITQIIDDPASELSIVFRKNAERAELESYLKGIRFLTGK